jgi:threonine dehydrogenase-like Zn-dependent dehydrogenase
VRAITARPPAKGSARLEDIPRPSRERGQALLRILSVGFDGTDREINEGVYGSPPGDSPYMVLGHEAVGIVDELGEEVDDLAEGDVVVPTVRRPGNCLNCREGQSDMCLDGDYYEHGIFRLHGFASDYALSDPRFLVKVPDSLRDVAVLLEPLSVGVKAVAQILKIQERMVWDPRDALVLGAGPLGLLTSMVLALKGLDVTVVATRGHESLKAEIVRQVGGTYVRAIDTPVKDMEGGFELIVEATGRLSPAREALSILERNGVMCFLGNYRETGALEGLAGVLYGAVLGNRLLFGSVNSNPRHFETGIGDMLEIGRRYGSVLSRLITGRLAPEEFQQAFEPDRESIKMVVCFDR